MHLRHFYVANVVQMTIAEGKCRQCRRCRRCWNGFVGQKNGGDGGGDGIGEMGFSPPIGSGLSADTSTTKTPRQPENRIM